MSIGVVGGGTMGAGIAQVFANAGYSVAVAESGDISAASARVRTGLEKGAAKKLLRDGLGETLGRIRVVGSVAELDPGSTLVVEAVPELPSLKREVLQGIEKRVGTDCVIASNTSSLSIDALATELRCPERFVGMHFFNPVPASTLVEIVSGAKSSNVTVGRAVEWVREIGKTEIIVRDSPGFATSRLGVLLGLEAIRMLEEGVADAESIDRAMELGYRHPMGPLRSTDLVGLDVRLAIAEYLATELGERFAPPQLLRDKVSRGELGRKSGQGFYAW